MQRAFAVSTVLGIILPCIGLPVLLKRLSMLGDTLAHASLAGVAIGLCFGFNPLIGSVVACVVAGLSVEVVSSRLRAYQEISTVIVLAAAIGLAGIFTSFTGGGSSISGYLFGSVVTISDLEFKLVLGVAAVVIVIYRLIYTRLYLSVFDPAAAPLLGINTKTLSLVFSLLVAIAVSVAAKTIGSLIVSSLLVIPSITAMQLARTYKGTLACSIGISLACMYSGLTISYYCNLKPGSVIVLISVAVLLATLLIRHKARS
nr:metal ABC transporter permease [Collinsella urealyticum]